MVAIKEKDKPVGDYSRICQECAKALPKKKHHSHNWVFAGKFVWENGLGELGNYADKFVCPDCEETKFVPHHLK